MNTRMLEFEGFEVFEVGLKVNSELPTGSLKSCRAKFALSQWQAALNAIVDEVTDGTLYLGDVSKGEIEITGIHRMISNRFWTEVEYSVLFPGKPGNDPVAGTYRAVRWNVGLDSGTAALCVTGDQKIVLARSFRHAVRGWCYELPRGVRKPEETLEECGFRESLEEAGVQKTGETVVIDLGRHDPDTGVLMQFPQIVAYTNVVADKSKINPDVSEAISGYMTASVDQVLEMIERGEITDGYTQAAILRGLLKGVLRSKRFQG